VKDIDVGPFRVHLEPVAVNRGGRFEWDDGNTSAVWSNRPLTDNLAAAFCRRQMEAYRGGLTGVSLDAPRPARLADVLGFLDGDTDDEKLHDLIWGLSLVERPPDRVDPEPADGPAVPFEFGVPRLLVEPLKLAADRGRWQLGGAEATVPDPEVFHALVSARGDAVGQCIDRAARRLKSGGWLVAGYRNRRQAGKSLAVVASVRPARLLAACLFPLSGSDLETIANAVLYPPETQE
jgi:CRISPR-associated protein Csx17